MPDKLVLTRSQVHLLVLTLSIAPFCTTVVSIRETLKQFFESHPDDQLFVFSVKREGRREP